MTNQKILNIAEIATAVGSVGGAIASIITQQLAYASVPLSLSVVLNVINRQRLLKQMTDHQQEQHSTLVSDIATVKQENQAATEKLATTIATQRLEDFTKIDQQNQQLQAESLAKYQELLLALQNLAQQHGQLAHIVSNLREIENFSQALRVDPNCAEFYYQRGQSHQHLGDKQGAIADYTEALHLRANYAQAYHMRGILQADLGNRRQAVEDLRKAAKLYFDQGDLDSYQRARDLSKEFYEINSPAPDEKLEKILIKTFLS